MVSLSGKEFVIRFTPCNQVGHQIKNVFFVHGIEEPWGHHGNAGWFDGGQMFGLHFGHRTRLHHIGVYPVLIVPHVHDSAVKLRAIVQAEDA